jgi:hypothetical protein
MSNGHWAEVEAIRHALDCQGGKQNHCSPVQYSEQPLGGFLGRPGLHLTALPINLYHTHPSYFHLQDVVIVII